jgi:hypothetical protein
MSFGAVPFYIVTRILRIERIKRSNSFEEQIGGLGSLELLCQNRYIGRMNLCKSV